jgi:hypothetical protein
MAYYNTIRDPSTFFQRSRGKANFAALSQDGAWKSGASYWGREHLFASRVLCSSQSARLPIFQALELFPEDTKAVHPCLDRLIKGPGNLTDLIKLSESQIVRKYEPDSLAYVWAALASFVKHGNAAAVDDAKVATEPAVPMTPKRKPKKPELYGSFVQSHQVQFGSSSPDYQKRPPSSDSDLSVGYVEELDAPLLEDATVRLVNCFVRCVLNYAQDLDQESPLLQFSDERLAYSLFRGNKKLIHAIDDGGIHLFDDQGHSVQVALLECKRHSRQS